MPNHFKITPSEMTFLYHECKHCFVNKIKFGLDRPSIPLPGIFSTIAALQKDHFSDKRTEDFCPDLPPGQVVLGEKWIRSKSITFEGIESTCYINGRFDVVMALDDGTYLVGDFKTGKPSTAKSNMYGRQLHAYSYSLEHPEEGALSLGPITKLGLLYFTPDRYDQTDVTRQILEGDLTWIEVEQNNEDFLEFIKGVMLLLDGEGPPPDPDNCAWCRYRKLTGQVFSEGAQSPTSPTCPECDGPMRLRKGKYGEFWSCTKFPECKGTRNP